MLRGLEGSLGAVYSIRKKLHWRGQYVKIVIINEVLNLKLMSFSSQNRVWHTWHSKRAFVSVFHTGTISYWYFPCSNLQNKRKLRWTTYEGESNENFKSVIKIRNTARLYCKLATVILMVWRVADRWQYDGGTQHDGAAIVLRRRPHWQHVPKRNSVVIRFFFTKWRGETHRNSSTNGSSVRWCMSSRCTNGVGRS